MSRRLSGIAYIGTMFAFVLLLSLFIFPGFSVNAARYASGETDYVVGVESNITILLPKENVSFMVEPGSEDVTAEKFQIGVYSNLPYGITIGMNTARVHTSETDYTANGLNSIHGNTLRALDNVTHESLFPENRWGYSLDGKYYYRMPAADDDYMAEIKLGSMEESGVKDVWVGSKVNTDQPLDYYYGTINFTVVTNIATKSIYDIFYMQEMDGDVAESMVTNRQYRLRDIRDNKEYWVSKLENGEVWMTQDLDLVLTPGMTLTTDNTDIKRASWVSEYDMTELNRDIYQAVPSISATYYNYEEDGTFRNYNGKLYGMDIDECLRMNSDNPKFCNHFLTGQKYTFLQASAANNVSDINAGKSDKITSTSYLASKESICPKGWRMPVTTEFPTVPSSAIITRLDENGRAVASATLDSSLVHEPYYLGNYTYLTAMVSSDYNYHYYYNYASPTSTSGYAISSGNALNVRCMARLTRNTFIIKYDLNGGTGNKPPDDEFETWDNEHAFLLPTPSPLPYREGYNFVGWATTPEATVPEYIPYQFKKDWYYYAEGQYVATTPETTLYAVWEPAIIVGFNANGGRFSSYQEGLGETAERTVYGFSTPTVLDRVVKIDESYSPRTESGGNSKSSIYDTSPYKNSVYTSGGYTSWIYDNTGPDKIQVTVYYAVPADSYLCVHQNSTSIDNNTYNCSNSITGNLAVGAPSTASNTPLFKKVFEVPCTRTDNGPRRCDSFSLSVYFRPGASNNDGTTNWYGFWIDEEHIYYNKAFQYRRFGTGNGGHYQKAPTRDGYRFLGWSKNPDATTADWTYDAWDDSTEVYFEEDLEVYAVWQKYVPFTIEVTTNDPEHVDILVASFEWNTGKSSPYVYRSTGTNYWYYYYYDENNVYRTVKLGEFHGSEDDFYKPTVNSPSISNPYNSWYDIPENGVVQLPLNYSETKVASMQDLTKDACAGAPVGLSKQLTDTRDNKKYWISKLADGACWMTQNMDYDFALGSYTVVPTTNGNQSIYTESTWNKSNNANVNNYFDGGDYYYANGVTPTSTEGLAEDAEEWHYHRGGFYNYHIAKYLCQTGSWTLGDFKTLFSSYLISQMRANSYTFAYTQAPLEAPLYFILESKDSNIPKPNDGYTSTSSSLRALYWSQTNQSLDIIRTQSSNYVPLEMIYSQSAEPSSFYGLTNTVDLNGAGFVRCMVK